MKSFSRKDYNSQYYAQNRERILKRRQQRKAPRQVNSQTFDKPDQLSLFENSTFQLNRQSTVQYFRVEYLTNGFLFLLVIANSYYLLGEAVEFYRSNSASIGSSLLAAVIVELLLLTLSLVQTTNLILKIAAKTALTLLFAYSAWSFCSNVIGRGYGSLEQLAVIEKKIERLEGRIKERNQLIEENLKLRRITMARRLTLEKDRFNEELSLLDNDRSAKIAISPKAQRINTFSMIVLRLLLQLSNIIIVHHLGSLLNRSQKRRTLRQIRPSPGIHLVRSTGIRETQ